MPLDAETIKAMYGGMTEAHLQEECERALSLAGWLIYHTHDSRRSDPGFPDIVAVRGRRIIWREVKTQIGKLTQAQIAWGRALAGAGADYGVWRPFLWGDGTIMREIS